MTLVMNANTRSWVKAFLMCALLFGAQMAMAAGGFDQVKSKAENIRLGILSVIGVVAAIALIFQGVQGMNGRKDWMDVAVSCAWVLFIACASALVAWLFTTGQSINFS